MDEKQKRKLQAAGFDVFEDGCDALGLTEAEKAIVDARMAAGAALEQCRAENPDVSQAELARRMGTRQPAVSRMMKDPSRASLETLLRALVAFGADRRKIASLFL